MPSPLRGRHRRDRRCVGTQSRWARIVPTRIIFFVLKHFSTRLPQQEACMSEPDKPTSDAIRTCAEWLATCVRLGWSKADLDALEALWWKYHDKRGVLIQVKPEPSR